MWKMRGKYLEQKVQENNQEPINTNGGPDLTESESMESFANINNSNLYLFYTVSWCFLKETSCLCLLKP